MRIGHGYDVHKFGSSKPLILAGETIDYEQGLIAHSDGDVVLHALCDALLGAIAAGDIGRHFPDTDPKFAGADSQCLLKTCYQLCLDKGFIIGNVDVTIVAQAPKMSPHIESMRANIANCLHCDLDQINVKATTTEKLGFAGRKEGIATHAVCLLVKKDSK
jgi:2-C-methyl-D-erythritol 2,4-cyclodiphosphate synthase